MPTLLTLLIACPFLGALVIAFAPATFRFAVRLVALATTLISLLLGTVMFLSFPAGTTGFRHEQIIPWVSSLGLNYHVGVDGISVGLVFMATIVAFAAVCVSRTILEREKEFYALLLVMIGGIFGAFASLDLLFFFVFHELALIPTFLMIGIWGRGENKNYATFNITLYLTAGAMITLVGLAALYLQGQPRTFDMVELARQFSLRPMAESSQQVIFPLLLFGFGILVSLWPFHTWAPLGYGAAPTATAMLHAGVLKKFGLYGLIRIAIPMMPDAAASWITVISYLCLGNIIYCGFVAMRQRDLNLLIGNSSVAHMGFVFLGIASLSLVGITGAVVIMVAHGLLAALSFAISGHIAKEAGTLEMEKMGGYLKSMPFLGSVFLMAAMAGCGLPGFANFVGEAMTLFAAYRTLPVVVSIAVWGGLVIGAIYMLRAVRAILHGPLREGAPVVPDAVGWWRKLPFVLLLLGLLVFGLWPRLLTDKIRPSVAALFQTQSLASVPNSAALPTPLDNR